MFDYYFNLRPRYINSNIYALLLSDRLANNNLSHIQVCRLLYTHQKDVSISMIVERIL